MHAQEVVRLRVSRAGEASIGIFTGNQRAFPLLRDDLGPLTEEWVGPAVVWPQLREAVLHHLGDMQQTKSRCSIVPVQVLWRRCQPWAAAERSSRSRIPRAGLMYLWRGAHDSEDASVSRPGRLAHSRRQCRSRTCVCWSSRRFQANSIRWPLLISKMSPSDRGWKHLRWGSKAEGSAWSLVERVLHLDHPVGLEVVEASRAREPLAQQTVGVLVRAPLPRAVRVAHVDHHPRRLGQLGVPVNLLALIPRQRPTHDSGSEPIAATTAAFSASTFRNPGSGARIVKRLTRSTSVAIAAERFPMMRSPSQCPNSTRSSTCAGRSQIVVGLRIIP